VLLHGRTLISIISYASSLGGRKLNHDHETETVVTRQLIPLDNANFYWQAEKSTSQRKTNAPSIAQTMWKRSITAVQFNANC